jgi:hypothetical protein
MLIPVPSVAPGWEVAAGELALPGRCAFRLADLRSPRQARPKRHAQTLQIACVDNAKTRGATLAL